MNYLFYNVFLAYTFATGIWDINTVVSLNIIWWMFYWFKKMLE